MATAAAAAKRPEIKDFNFTWVGQDRGGKTVRGETRVVVTEHRPDYGWVWERASGDRP